ncbi:4-hydroxy-3-methylbut-2-enyl diphosphate reductase [bacterium]|nr:4-hydroxy-3-methylbut-2-enyl diphosphate reductase [bacterium]
MNVIVAKNAGFCWGVKRAVTLSRDAARKKGGRIYTYGPLIHNRSVIKRLEAEGVHVLPEHADAHAAGAATLIIRAHGVPPGDTQRLVDAGYDVIDGTCPHVVKIQKEVARAHKAGRTIVIVGDSDHAEVRGLLGFCGGKGIVVAGVDEIAAVPRDEPVTVVAQSTLDEETFAAVSHAVKNHCADAAIVDTRCNATAKTQREAIALCAQVDAIVIVGGRDSANTNRLAQLCREQGVRTFHVEEAGELRDSEFAGVATVGITAGSSTPDWLIAEVAERLRAMPPARALNTEH